MSFMDDMKKPAAFGLTVGLLLLIVVGAIFSGVMSVILIVLAYFLGNAAGASAAPDVFGRRPPVIKKSEGAPKTAITQARDTEAGP